MSREEMDKLLGGYATDTLGEAERRALFEAALEDQELFDALAKEQALRDVLHDPQARQQLLEALGPAPAPVRVRGWGWLRQPTVLGMAGGLAALLVVAALVLRRPGAPAHRELVVPQVRTPSVPPQAAPPPKRFEPLQRSQEQEIQTEISTPSAAGGRSHGAAVAPSAILPMPPPLPAETVARLTPPAAAPAAIAGQLNFRPNAGVNLSVSGAFPQTRAKMARAAALASTTSNLGVHYSLLVKGVDGEYAPARLDTEFHPGDSIRLRLVPNDGGYVYLFQRDLAGAWRLAWSQRVEKGQTFLLPASGALQYDRPGPKELLVVLSAREEASLAGLATAELDALTASVSAEILKAMVLSGDTAYVIDTRTPADQQRVAFKVTLQFR